MADFQPKQANCIWQHDGNVYYSDNADQYKLMKNAYWQVMKWSGVEAFYATGIWRDTEGNTYLYKGNVTYKLSGTEWEQVEMTLPEYFEVNRVWHDHGRTLHTDNSGNTYILNSSQWISHVLNNHPTGQYINGNYVWHDVEGNSYIAINWDRQYNNGKQQLKLVGDTWTPVTFETPGTDGKLNCEYSKVISGVLYTDATTYNSMNPTFNIFAKFTGSAWEQSDFNNIIKRKYYTGSYEQNWYTSPINMWYDTAGNVYYTYNFGSSNNTDYATYKLVNNEWKEVMFESPFESGMSYGKATRRYLDLDGLNLLAVTMKRYIYDLVQKASIPDSEVGVFHGIQEDILAAQEEIASLKKDMAKVKQDVSNDLQQSINELRSEIENMKPQLGSDLQQQLDDLSAKVDTAQATAERFGTLAEQVARHEQQLDGVYLTFE